MAAGSDGSGEEVYTLVLLRHGESEWNKLNLFTGWTDVKLTEQGVSEAQAGGRLMCEAGFAFDVVHTSVLRRAICTAHLALEEMGQAWVPMEKSWRLNERHYGALQGLNKAETAEKFGAEQVKEWRRSFATPPPPLEDGDERLPEKDRRYAKIDATLLPRAESLKLTIDRVMPLWESTLAPQIRSGANLLIAAHGNSIRALVKFLDDISEDDIVGVNIPTGVPLVYKLDKDLKPIPQPGAATPLSGVYLGDAEEAKAKAAAVAAQASKKE